MIGHVHRALEQVRTIHQHILEKQRFKGYSGRARAASGCVALAAGLGLSHRQAPSERISLLVWIGVALACIAINYGAVLVWFFRDPKGERQAVRLKPLIEVVPALAVGGLLTLGFLCGGIVDYLPAVWMLMFGLANLSSRHVLPKGMGWVGLFYVIAGSIVLFEAPTLGLLNPWPMAGVFFVGEWFGGLVLHFDGPNRRNWRSFLGLAPAAKDYDPA